MAATFGAAVGDDINHTLTGDTTMGQPSSSYLVAGWWYPTTLTAGRGYAGWSAATSYMRVAATTSELEVAIDRVTTDALWTSTTAGILVDQWNFIALVASFNSSGTPALRLWTSVDGNIPTEKAIAVTTNGSGTGTSSNSRIVGSTGASVSQAFQGDIGQVHFLHSSNLWVIPTAAFGTITQAEADRIFNTLVLPLYLGEINQQRMHGSHLTAAGVVGYAMFDQETISPSVARYGKGAAGDLMLSNTQAPTINGAVVSARRQKGLLVPLGCLAHGNAKRR